MIVATLRLTAEALDKAAASADAEVSIAANALALYSAGGDVCATIDESGAWTVVAEHPGLIADNASAWLTLCFGSDATWHGYHPLGRAAGAAARAADLLGGTIAYDADLLRDADGDELPPGAVY